MRQAIASVLILSLLAGCAHAPSLSTGIDATSNTTLDALAATAPSKIKILQAEITQDNARIEYEVVRKDRAFKKVLAVAFKGDASQPSTLKEMSGTLNGKPLTARSISKSEQKMLEEELEAILDYQRSAYRSQSLGVAIGLVAGVGISALAAGTAVGIAFIRYIMWGASGK